MLQPLVGVLWGESVVYLLLFFFVFFLSSFLVFVLQCGDENGEGGMMWEMWVKEECEKRLRVGITTCTDVDDRQMDGRTIGEKASQLC